MRQIGGERSELFSLDDSEMTRFVQAVREGQLGDPIIIRDEGPGGGTVRFRSLGDATSAQQALSAPSAGP